jgi:hypothetical protein
LNQLLSITQMVIGGKHVAQTDAHDRVTAQFHPHAQRNAFRRRDARQQSRLFARCNQRLKHTPNSIRLC